MDAIFVSSAQEAKPDTSVVLRVGDKGCGIPPEITDNIFDPYFTTKGPDKGTSLPYGVNTP